MGTNCVGIFLPLLSLIDTLSQSHVFGSKVFSGKTNSGQKVRANRLCLLCPQHHAKKEKERRNALEAEGPGSK